jgi:transposase
MCLNENGFPICFKIFEGNIQDKKTVIGFLEGLNKEFRFNSYIFVGDRGMVTVENLEKIKSIGLGYIVALTHTEARQLLNDIDVQQLELYDKQVPIEILGDVPHKAKYVLCGSEYRKEHDLKLFNKILEKGRKALESVQAMVDNGRIKNHDKIIKRAQKKLTKSNADQYYDFEYKNDMLEIIEKTEKIKLGEKLCGYYILKSTEPSVPDENTEQYYKQLQTVEGAFRELKELVQVRPIFHWNDQRVLTHVYLCVVSQAIINQCRRILKVTRWIYQEKENSIYSFLNILSEIHLGRFNIEGIEEWVVSSLGTDHKKILNMFNINDKEFENYKKANVVKN